MENLQPTAPATVETSTQKLTQLLTSDSLSYDSSVYVMYNYDFENGKYVFMSPGIKELTGYSMEEINVYGFRSIVKEVYSKKVDRYSLNGVSNILVEEFYAKYLVQTIDDKLKWIEDNSFSYINENEERSNAIGILRDNSALQNFINELNTDKNNLDTIFDLSDAMLIQVDTDLNILMINQKGCRILNGEKEDIVGKNLKEFIPPANRTSFNTYVNNILSLKGQTSKNTSGRIISLKNEIKYNSLVERLNRLGRMINKFLQSLEKSSYQGKGGSAVRK